MTRRRQTGIGGDGFGNGSAGRRRFAVASRGGSWVRREDVRRLAGSASRGDGIVRAGPAVAAWRGFTLIEVLLATVLLASGLALAFTTLRAATGTAQRGEALAARSERMRAVEGFLRRRIAGARPLTFALDDDSGQQQRFIGDAGRMRFVADVPDYLGSGGPYLHELVVEEDGDGLRLTVALTMVQAGTLVAEAEPRPPEVLVSGMQEVRFLYRALEADNTLGEWHDQWEQGERMPLQVQVLLRDGDGRDWPPLVVALPLASSYAAMSGEVL